MSTSEAEFTCWAQEAFGAGVLATTAALEHDAAVFHVLDAHLDPARGRAEVQRRIAAVIG